MDSIFQHIKWHSKVIEQSDASNFLDPLVVDVGAHLAELLHVFVDILEVGVTLDLSYRQSFSRVKYQ